MSNPIISKLTSNDKQNVFDLIQNNKVMNFLGPRRALTDDEALNWFKKEFNEQSRFTFRTADTLELIGFCGISEVDRVDDFAYFLREKFWGKGFATQMCQIAIKRLKQNFDFDEVRVFIADDNIGSLKLANKLNWIPIQKDINEFETGTVFHIR
ncbi:MAG: GNAT family N-acetyltransferase [Saccharospirillaceae bacterium]|nr:GNAT family N-acetyltransferase [Pseudomonadales bacterium]NRB81237.1 GNAT family N-acetyltransferase [Saccharospirillaceae bacterium]